MVHRELVRIAMFSRFYSFWEVRVLNCDCISVRRFFSTLIDFYIFNFVFIFFRMFFVYLINFIESFSFFIFLFFVSFFFTYIFPKKVFRGQSIGMFAMQYEILSITNGKRLSFLQHILRVFAQSFNILAFFIPYLVSIFHFRKSHLADLVTNSHAVVVKSKLLNNSLLDVLIGFFAFSYFLKNFFMYFSKDAMIDLFGNLWYGETARFFLLVVIFFELSIFMMNLFKVRWYIFVNLFYFLMYLLSHFVTILHLSRYRTVLLDKATETYGLYFSLIEKANPVFDSAVFLENFIFIFRNVLPFLVFVNFLFCFLFLIHYFFSVLQLSSLRGKV